jgi:hypothetical protein
MPREIVIPVSRLSPLLVEAHFFAVLVEPLDLGARQRLIEAEYRLFEPLHMALDQASKRDLKLHKRAVRVIQQERLLAAECALAYIVDRIVKERGAQGIELRADGEPLGPLTMENYGLWAQRIQRQLRGWRDDPDKVTAKNFEQLAWRYTKPVLHLAMVAHLMTRNCAPVMKPLGAAALSEAFGDPVATNALFDVAEKYRGILLDIARRGPIKLEEKDTIRIRAE